MNRKISACLIVNNEEGIIRRCLESIKNVVDEIVVVHDGEPTDKTLDICKEYTDKIFVRKFAGAMEYHLKFALDKTVNSWVLRIDADEFLSKELESNICKLTQNDNIDAYEFVWPLWDGKKRLTVGWPHKRSLFKKEKISFLAVPHYVIDVKGKVEKTNYILEHRPNYNNFAWETFNKKWLRWARLQAVSYLSDFKNIEKYNFTDQEWPFKIRLKIKYPLIFFPIDFIWVLIWNVASLDIKGYPAFRYLLMQSTYKAMINYYIFKLKNKSQ